MAAMKIYDRATTSYTGHSRTIYTISLSLSRSLSVSLYTLQSRLDQIITHTQDII